MQDVKNKKLFKKIIQPEQTNPDYALYKAILETSMDGFWMTDADGNILEVNNAYCNMVGYIREELVSMSIKNVEVLESPAEIKKHIKMLNKTGSHRFNTKHKCKNGKIIELEVRANSLKDGSKKAFAFFRDITDHMKAEAELKKSRKDWENIFQAIGQPSFILDPEQRIIAANRATIRITGKTAEQILGKKCCKILHKTNCPPEMCPFKKALISSRMETEEIEMNVFGGIYLVSCTPVFNDNGSIEKVIHIATDITERKQFEKKLYEYQSQLKLLTSKILLAEENERHRIAAGIHDEIGQRLAIVKFWLDSLRASETRLEVSSSLKRQSELISQAIKDVRSFTFELSNPLLYEIGIEAAVEAWLLENIQNKCNVKCKFISRGPKINLREEIRIVLFLGVRELVTNVIKHAKANEVEIKILRSNNNICIIVDDNGIGYSPAAEKTSKKVKRGFGLFNLRERLEYLGGNLEIQSVLLKGTRVTMCVPIELNEVVTEEKL